MELLLNGIDAECIIGDLPDERERAQHLRVDARLEIENTAAFTDELSDTADYAKLAGKVRAALVAAKCRMVERAARVACEACADDRRILSASVRVTKNGAVPGLESATAEYAISRRGSSSGDASALAGRLVAILSAQGLTCAAAESCTGGGVGAAITSVPGSSEVFAGGVVSYSNEAKRNILGVSADALDKFGAVSPQVAAQMADGARRLLGTDLAVSVTGIAGPGGGSAEKPVGLVWFGVSSAKSTRTEKAIFAGDRAQIRRQAVIHALGMLMVAAT